MILLKSQFATVVASRFIALQLTGSIKHQVEWGEKNLHFVYYKASDDFLMEPR
jgi:hypothetical protein